jgi:NAD(P)H dehydrogenase (quinone)
VIGTTGATGEVGGRIARLLSSGGVKQRLIVRDEARVPELPDAEVVIFGGYDDEKGMRQAFDGVSTLFLVSAREAPERVEQHKKAVGAAVSAKVDRIVYLSLIGAAPDATFTFARDHFETEEYIRSAAVQFTFSRQNLYMDILPFLGGEEGVIRGPAGTGRMAPVLRDDVAESIVTMLTGSGHEGSTYQLTGPEALTLAQIAEELSKASGREVRYENESLEEARASRTGYNAPDWGVAGWITTYTSIAAGELEVVTDDVKRLTGHDPVGLREFLSTPG